MAEQELRTGAFGSELPDRLRELGVGIDHSTSPDGFAPLHWVCYHGRAEVRHTTEGGHGPNYLWSQLVDDLPVMQVSEKNP